MTDNARRTSELPTANTIGGSDRLVFLYQANTAAPSTRTITLSNLSSFISVNKLVSGPNANNANNSGPYYFTFDNNAIATFPSVYGNGAIGQFGSVEGTYGIDYASANGSLWTSLTYTMPGGNAAIGTNTSYAWLGGNFGYNSPDSANLASFFIQLPSNANSTASVGWAFNPDGSFILPPLVANSSNPNYASIIFSDGTRLNSNVQTISNTSMTYHSGGGVYTLWTASSPAVVAAKVTVRVQSDMNTRTEIFTVDVVKDIANTAFTVSGQVTSNSSYGASVISAGEDSNNNLFVSHQDPNGYGNGYTVKAVEFTNNW